MAQTLQEQLLAMGLTDKKKAKQAEKQKKKNVKEKRKGGEVIDEAKVLADKAKQEKLARDKTLNSEKKAAAEAKAVVAQIKQFIKEHKNKKEMKPFIKVLKKQLRQWQWNTVKIAFKANKNRDMVGSASVDYLMYSGYIVMAYFWAKMADAAYTKMKEEEGLTPFYVSKIQTAEFYYDRILPRTLSLQATMQKNPDSIMQMSEEGFTNS